MPPSTRPSRSAYKGAVSGAQFFLKMVTNAVTIPPIRPPIIQGRAACGSGECARPQVQAEEATTHSSSTPVLLTVPCSVIASPTATSPRNAARHGQQDRGAATVRGSFLGLDLGPGALARAAGCSPLDDRRSDWGNGHRVCHHLQEKLGPAHGAFVRASRGPGARGHLGCVREDLPRYCRA